MKIQNVYMNQLMLLLIVLATFSWILVDLRFNLSYLHFFILISKSPTPPLVKMQG